MCVLACVGLNGGLVGMSVCAALTLMGMFQWAIRQSAEVENLVCTLLMRHACIILKFLMEDYWSVDL